MFTMPARTNEGGARRGFANQEQQQTSTPSSTQQFARRAHGGLATA